MFALAQVGQFSTGGVGQFYSGANTKISTFVAGIAMPAYFAGTLLTGMAFQSSASDYNTLNIVAEVAFVALLCSIASVAAAERIADRRITACIRANVVALVISGTAWSAIVLNAPLSLSVAMICYLFGAAAPLVPIYYVAKLSTDSQVHPAASGIPDASPRWLTSREVYVTAVGAWALFGGSAYVLRLFHREDALTSLDYVSAILANMWLYASAALALLGLAYLWFVVAPSRRRLPTSVLVILAVAAISALTLFASGAVSNVAMNVWEGTTFGAQYRADAERYRSQCSTTRSPRCDTMLLHLSASYPGPKWTVYGDNPWHVK
jgi:hypothetical protein